MERKRRERAARMYELTVIAICIVCMFGMIGYAWTGRARAREQERQIVRHEREYDTRMSAIDRGREKTGENAMLNAAGQWVKKERR